MGFYISFAGNITFEKSGALRELAKSVPLERLLLETDSPYISPQGLRGRRNEPANVKYLLDVYSGIYKRPVIDIAKATTDNANRLFGLGMGKNGKVVYEIRDSLYLNITNRCTNRCSFCARQSTDYVKGHNLKLDHEPSADEVISCLGDVKKYKEVVFCGYGEPTLRLNAVKKIASYVKNNGGRVRVNTNGEADLIHSRPVASELKGLVDRVSVSLNAPDSAAYDALCVSVFGEKAFGSIQDFIRECVKEGIEADVTCLDMLGEDGIDKCKKMAMESGAVFRLRHLGAVG
jgi:TatD DNase family protein